MKKINIFILSVFYVLVFLGVTLYCTPMKRSSSKEVVEIMGQDKGYIEAKHGDSYRILYKDECGKWEREWFKDWEVEIK